MKNIDYIDEYKFDGSSLMYLKKEHEIYLANFCPIVDSLEQDIASQAQYLTFIMKGDNIEEKHRININELNNIKQLYPLMGITNPEIRGLDKHFVYIIKKQLKDAKKLKILKINEIGWKRIDNFNIYFHGKGFFSDKHHEFNFKINFDDAISQNCIVDDASISETESFNYMMKLINLHGDISMILSATLILGILRTLFEEAGLNIEFVTYLVGGQGLGKTTLAKLFSNIFDDDMVDTIIGLNSSLPVIEKRLATYKDSVIVVDDLFTTESSSLMRTQEAKFASLVRSIANNSPRMTKSGNNVIKYSCHAMVIITGEYVVGSSSDLTRCIILENNIMPNKEILTQLQLNRKLLSRFVGYFLEWAASNYDNIVGEIKKRNIDTKMNILSQVNENERLQKNFFVIDTGFCLFLKYAKEKGFITEQESEYMYNCFVNARNSVFNRQVEIINKLKGKNKIYSFYDDILKLFSSGEFKLKHKSKGPFDLYDGVIKNNFLYLSKDKLCMKLQQYYQDNHIRPKDIIAQLDYIGVLKKDKSGASTVKLDGTRFLRIKL